MSSSSSEAENETTQAPARLGECEVCGDKEAIYTCPKCEVKTCSLSCVRIHRKELECDGIRDRTKFIRMKDFTDMDLSSDYRLLEECSRFVYAVKRNEKKKYTLIERDLPFHLHKLKMAARKRGIVLHYLAQNFTRNQINTTRYHYRKGIINWRVEWVFPNAEPNAIKFVDDHCPENKKLSDLVDKYLTLNAMPFDGSKALTYYKSVGLHGVKILLRAEKVKGSAKKFFEMDPSESLAENLSGKCIVEFPILFVVLKDHCYNFEIISPEDEFDYQKEEQAENGRQINNKRQPETTKDQINQYHNTDNSQSRKRPRQLLTEKIAQEKKLEIEKEIKEERKKKPKNLLFTTAYSSEESLDCSDDDDSSKG